MKVTKPHDPTDFVAATNALECCVVTGGGAWRTTFFVGLYKALQEGTTAEERSKWAFCGCSSGSLIALGLALEYPHEKMLELYEVAIAESRKLPLGVAGRGPAGPGGKMIRAVIYDFLPEAEMLARIRGRFAVTFNTRPSCCGSLTACQASDFESADEVYHAMLGSGNIPLFTDWRTVFRSYIVGGVPALDGGYTWGSRRPMLPCRSTLYSICCGAVPGGDATLPAGVTTDICPHGGTELVPVHKCFFTPPEAYVAEMLKDGYEQTKAFLASETWAARIQMARAQGPDVSRA